MAIREWHAPKSAGVDYLIHYYFSWILVIIWIFQSHHLESAVLTLLSALVKADSQVMCLNKISFSLPRVSFHSSLMPMKS